MFTLLRPTDDAIRAHLARHAAATFTYDFVGCTREEPAPVRGYSIDRNRVLLGAGRATYERAKDAIRRWEMFPAALAQLCWRDQPPRPDLVVGVLYRVWLAPLWVLFPARVVYLLDETHESPTGRIHRFGFAYGTVADHPERGEERFQVEWHETPVSTPGGASDGAGGSVYYDLVAISQPAHWLAQTAYPYTRYEQARFRRLSGEAMQLAVAGPSGKPL
jgi:uncharacterized protein (UPF0548 family)